MKVANEPRKIRETNYADFRNVDIGVMFGSEFKGQRLRKLSDFLKAAKGKAKLMIEFKDSQDTDLIEETIRLVKKYGMQDDVMLVSLTLEEVRQAQRLTSEIPIGYFALKETGDLTKLNVDFIGLQDNMITPELVQEIKEHRFNVYGWTVDEPERILELIEMGIDGIITNDPLTTARIIRNYQALSPAQHSLLSFRRFWRVFYKMGLWKPQPPGETVEM
jgi:glycerophosphoryl diester phosphodiesterase